MTDHLITAAQAAERLGCSVRTVNRLIAAEQLAAAMRVPGATGARLFLASDVEALAGKRKVA